MNPRSPAMQPVAGDGEGVEPKPASKELAEWVARIVAEYRPVVDASPGLLSLLYDIDLMPEQLLHVLRINPPAVAANCRRMMVVCDLWVKAHPPALTTPAVEPGSDGRG